MSFCLATVHMKEKDMQCEASTPVCSNQGVQLLGSVYMCCNKLTATCTKVNGDRLELLTLLAESVYMYYFLTHLVLPKSLVFSVLSTYIFYSHIQSEVLSF